MQTVERRANKRLPVPHDRAQTMVVIGKREYRAVIADMSSSGFGLLMLRGIPAEVGGRIRLVTEEGINECEIIHTRREENFLHVGTKRLSEVSFDELPKYGRARQYFKQSVATASPLIFLAVVLGFTTVMIGMIIVVDVASGRHAGEVETVAEIDLKPVEEPTRVIVKDVDVQTPRQIVAAEVADYLKSAGETLDALQNRHVKMLATVLDGSGREWDEVAQELNITPQQNEEIRTALEAEPEDQSTLVTRARVMSFLDADQRAGLSKILATISTP